MRAKLKSYVAVLIAAVSSVAVAASGTTYDAAAVSLEGTVFRITTDVVGTSRRTKVSTASVGGQVLDFDVTPDGATIVVANSSAVFFVRTQTMATISSSPAEGCSGAVRITPDGAKTWVGSGNGKDVWVFDVQTRQLVQHLIVPDVAPFTGGIRHIAFSPNGATAYLSLYYGGLLEYDVASYTFLNHLQDGGGPVEVSPDGRYIYAFNGVWLNVIDAATRAVTSTPYYLGSGEMTLSPDGATLYVVDSYARIITALDTALIVSGAADATKQVLPIVGAQDAAVSLDGALLYIATGGMEPMRVVDASTLATIDTVPVTTARRVVTMHSPR